MSFFHTSLSSLLSLGPSLGDRLLRVRLLDLLLDLLDLLSGDLLDPLWLLYRGLGLLYRFLGGLSNVLP